MKIAVFGMGYVGVVSAACLARDGHEVIGVDPQPNKVAMIKAGHAPIVERHVDVLIADAAREGRLTATTDAAEAIAAADASLVCVGTPSRPNGSLDTTAVRRVCEQIGAAIKATGKPHLVVLRSTILPGTMKSLVIPTLEEASGRSANDGLRIANNPEFLREGTAVQDYDNPPKTIVGALDETVAEEVLDLYRDLPGPKIATSLEIAEMVKYTDNAWHALKVAFGNEIGAIAKRAGVDSWKVMDIFCQDTKLNISPAYLRPGFAFGGSCLPKDVRALLSTARAWDIDTPVLAGILPSNVAHIDRAFEAVAKSAAVAGSRRIAFLGVSFKAGTDDLRESPQITLAERLIGKGYDLRVFDRSVHLARLTGANKDYLDAHIPHIAEILSDDLDAVLAHGDLVVVGNPDPVFATVPDKLRDDQRMVDLARLAGAGARLGERYVGVNW
jgi:GDP-mannose 6-dehydrogenase